MRSITGYSLIFITLLFIASCNKMSSNERLNIAQKEYDINNYAAAIIQLKNLIRDEPENKDARRLMADSHYQLGNFLNAEKEFLKSIELGVDLEEIAFFYVNTLYGTEDHLGVISFWEQNTEVLSDTLKARIAPVTSMAYLNQTRSQESYEIALRGKELAAKVNSTELLTINTAIADTFNPETKMNEAIIELEKACKQYTERWVICNFFANALFSNEEFDKAAEIIESILQTKPNHTVLAIKLADSYVRAKNVEKAELYINALLKTYPNHPFVNLLAATIELDKENFTLALNHINTSINAGFVTPQTKLVASIVHFQLGNDEQALYHLEGLKSSYPNNTLITQLYIAIQLRLGNTESITNAYSQSNASSKNSEIFALASLEFLKAGDSEQSSALLQKIDASLIQDQNILNSVSLAKLATDDKSGITDLENALKKLDEKSANIEEISKVKVLLISSLLANNENEKALDYAQSWDAGTPNIIENKIFLIEIARQNKNESKVESTFGEILKIDPTNEFANIYFGQKSYLTGKFNNAENHFKTAIISNKFNILAIKGYLNAQKALNNKENGLVFLKSNFKDINNIREKITLSQIYLLANSSPKALELLKTVKSEMSTIQTNLLLAEAYSLEQSYTESISIYEKYVFDGNVNNKLIEKLAVAYEKSKNVTGAVNTFEKLKSENPNNTQIGLILANFQLFNNQHNETLLYIDSLTTEQQSHPAIVALKGKAFYFAKKYSQAIPYLSESYSKTKDSKLMPLIFDSKIKLNQVDGAFADMEKHLEENPNATNIRAYYANELSKHDKAKAMSQYEELIISDSSNLLALNNLAWLLYEAGNFSEAKKYIDMAMKIGPSNVDVIDTNNKINQALSNR